MCEKTFFSCIKRFYLLKIMFYGFFYVTLQTIT